MQQFHISFPVQKTLNETATWLVVTINEILKTKDRVNIALSGGSTPKALYELLASEFFIGRFHGDKINFFWGDERHVPITDERNNAKMALETLLYPIGVSPDNIHYFDTSLSPEEAVANYDQLLHSYFDGQETSFDITLLGLGTNGHTLSLFPKTSILTDETSWVRHFWLEEEKIFRLTLMPNLVNRSRNIVYLVTGKEKVDILPKVITGKQQPLLFPAQLIKPLKGKMHWFIDSVAAMKLRDLPV